MKIQAQRMLKTTKTNSGQQPHNHKYAQDIDQKLHKLKGKHEQVSR